MDIVERLAQQAAETINGGEFNDGKWYTEGQRQAWRKAMTPAADEIERLRKASKRLGEIATDAVEWLPPASVNGPREKYQNEIKELTDGHC